MADTIKEILESYRPKAFDVLSPINATITQDKAIAEIKRIIEEAKPEADINMFPTDYCDGIEEYYRNLLKALC